MPCNGYTFSLSFLVSGYSGVSYVLFNGICSLFRLHVVVLLSKPHKALLSVCENSCIGGPKLRRWYGAPDLLPKDGNELEEDEAAGLILNNYVVVCCSFCK